MRTTLTLDDDVASAVERLRHDQRRSLREVVNDLLRRGLAAQGAPKSGPPTAWTRSVTLGGCRLPDVDNVSEVLAVVEGEDRR
jgi:hypothetical protein